MKGGIFIEYLENIKNYLRENLICLLILVMVVLSLVFDIYQLVLKKNDNNTQNWVEEKNIIKEDDVNNDDLKPLTEKVKVDIKGAVKKPNVYEVENNKIVNDIIKLAGGLNSNADTTNINLSRKVFNEMVIYIPKKASKQPVTIINDAIVKENDTIVNFSPNKDQTSDAVENVPNDKENIKVNINTASLEQLMTISGIGEAKAKSIIEYRQTSPFKNIEDIKNISGIGDSLFEKIKEYITV